jgi:hypothetical protein
MPSQFSGPPWYGVGDELDRATPPGPRPREYPLWGFHGQGAEGEYYSSLSADSALEAIRALYYATTALETAGTLSSPAAGHAHDAANTHMAWNQVGSWRTYTLQRTAFDGRPGARVVDETSETLIALIPFSLPLGASRVIPSALIQIPTSGVGLKIRLQFYEPANINAASADVDGGYLSATGIFGVPATATSSPASTDTPRWLEGSSIDLSGIGLTSSKRLVYLKVSAQVTSGTADLYQIQLGLDPNGYADLTLVDPSDTAATPDEAVTDDELNALFINNPLYLRQSIFGVTYSLPRHSRPHDHGEGRGEVLTDRHLLSLVYGPHVAEGGGASAGGTIGIPVLVPATSVDYATTEKVLTEQGLFVPGGVASIDFRAVLYEPGGGGDDLSFLVEVRPLEDVGYGPGDNLGITGQLSFEDAGNDFQEATVTLDLSPLGDIHRDRVFDLVVWQADNPSVGTVHRFCCLLGTAGTAPTTLPEISTHQPREELPVAKVLEGQELSTLLADKASRVLNQLSYEALGGVPGLETDLRTVDTTDPWRRLLTTPHQHRGTYEDSAGNRVDDGAVIRRPLWSQAYTANVAADSTTEGTTGSTAPVLGQKIQPTGTASGSAGFSGRLSVPAGLRAADIYALIQPGNSHRITRCYVTVNANPINTSTNQVSAGTSGIHVGFRTGPFSAQASSAGADLVCEVLPVDGVAWQDNAARLASGQSLWTVLALKSVADLPDTVSVTNVPRWTAPIRLEWEPDPGDTGAYDLDLTLYFAIQYGAQNSFDAANTYTAQSRLLSLLVVPAADDPAPTHEARTVTVSYGTSGAITTP